MASPATPRPPSVGPVRPLCVNVARERSATAGSYPSPTTASPFALRRDASRSDASRSFEAGSVPRVVVHAFDSRRLTLGASPSLAGPVFDQELLDGEGSVTRRPSTATRLLRPKARQSWARSPLPSPVESLCVSGSASEGELPPLALPAAAAAHAPDDSRRVPMYMYTLDLAFAAAFTVCAGRRHRRPCLPSHRPTERPSPPTAEWIKLSADEPAVWSSPPGGARTVSPLVAVARFFLLFLPLARLWDHTNSLFNRFDAEDLVTGRRSASGRVVGRSPGRRPVGRASRLRARLFGRRPTEGLTRALNP